MNEVVATTHELELIQIVKGNITEQHYVPTHTPRFFNQQVKVFTTGASGWIYWFSIGWINWLS
jgi:hypothetical protein